MLIVLLVTDKTQQSYFSYKASELVYKQQTHQLMR